MPKDQLKEIIEKINKQYGENTITVASEDKYPIVERLPSGSLFLDWALGVNKKSNVGGWPLGRIVEVYGPEGAGKTLIAMKTVAEAQRAGHLCVYVDCENAMEKEQAQRAGVDLSRLILTREQVVEDVFNLVNKMLEEFPQIKVVVIDSIAALMTRTQDEKEIGEKNQMAERARVLGQSLPKLISVNKNNALIILINQLRSNPGVVYGNPEYTPGGNAIKYYDSIKLEVRKGDWITGEGGDEEKKERLGHVVKFKVTKNKTDMPWREGYFKFLYKDASIDRVDELVSLGLLKDLIDRRGAYYSICDQSFQGREALEKKLRTDEEFFKKVRAEIFGKEAK